MFRFCFCKSRPQSNAVCARPGHRANRGLPAPKEEENPDYVRILTDSAADLPEELARQLNVEVLPLGVTFEDGMAYRDRVDLQPEEFYEKLAACEKLPKTSQPNLGDVLTAFESARDAGDEMVAIFISSQLSGTYQSACMAADTVEYPGIHVVDSLNAAMGQHLLVRLAVRLRDEGFKKPLKIAIMGCVVNGPGEASDADIGIAGGKDEALLFIRGEKIRMLKGDIVGQLLEEIHKM